MTIGFDREAWVKQQTKIYLDNFRFGDIPAFPLKDRDWLHDTMAALRDGPVLPFKLPRSTSFYVRAAIEEALGIRLPVGEVERLLKVEQLA